MFRAIITRASRAAAGIIIGVGLVGAAAAPAGAVTGPNLVKQASFEVPITPPGAPWRLYRANGRIGHWQVSEAKVAVAQPVPGLITGTGTQNQQFLSLRDPGAPPGAASPGTVCQTIALDPAASYVLSFSSAALDDPSSSVAPTLTPTWQGVPLATVTDPPSSEGDTVWTRHRFDLGAAGGLDSGALCLAGGGDGFAFVDLVVVKAAGH